MELQGTVKKIFDTETFASGFQKRTLVVTTKEQYPQTIPVEFSKDKVELLNSLSEGDEVKVGINIRGSEWKGKYYASISGWRLESLSPSTPNAHKEFGHGKPAKKAQKVEELLNEEEDDLPF